MSCRIEKCLTFKEKERYRSTHFSVEPEASSSRARREQNFMYLACGLACDCLNVFVCVFFQKHSDTTSRTWSRIQNCRSRSRQKSIRTSGAYRGSAGPTDHCPSRVKRTEYPRFWDVTPTNASRKISSAACYGHVPNSQVSCQLNSQSKVLARRISYLFYFSSSLLYTSADHLETGYVRCSSDPWSHRRVPSLRLPLPDLLRCLPDIFSARRVHTIRKDVPRQYMGMNRLCLSKHRRQWCIQGSVHVDP